MTTRKQEEEFRDETPATSEHSTVQGQNALLLKVVELCPDLFIHVPSPFGPGGIHWRTASDDSGNPVSPGAHVDLLNDLNACAEMLNTLPSDGSWSRYRTELEKVCNTLGQSSNTAWFLEHNATAEQRCRAFVALHEGKSDHEA